MIDLQAHTMTIQLTGIARSFGPVKALRGVDLAVPRGQVIGLVGHNGAGKSTLMNVISGVLSFDTGRYRIGGVEQGSPGAPAPGELGIGVVSQELLLAPNLTVAENARLVHRSLKGFGWRRRAAAMMSDSLNAIFPGHGIHPDELLADLPIGKRQMVEIARAFAGTDIALMILDEPTSSLDASASEQLLAYVEKRRREGMSAIFISHLLGEILDVANRIVVMRDGTIVMDAPADGLSRDDLVAAMGHITDESTTKAAPVKGRKTDTAERPPCVAYRHKQDWAVPVDVRPGEIIGLAGLAGRGQTEFLHAVNRGQGVRPKDGRKTKVAFVAGDRRADGIFTAWSVQQNLTIRAMNGLRRWGLIDAAAERALSDDWKSRISIRTASLKTDIVTLSGGNQQKVLFARALASDADIILMDDPMRGVDVGTKMEVYALIQKESERGRCFIWYTTEFEELHYCDRVYVFRDGAAAAQFQSDEVTETNVVGASFAA